MRTLGQNTSRLEFAADVSVLQVLSSPESRGRLESVVETMDFRDRQNFLRGYCLGEATALFGILEFVIHYPDLLGFDADENLARWFGSIGGERQVPMMSAVSEPPSELGQLCSVVDSLMTGLRRSNGDSARTEAVLEQCGFLAAWLRESFAQSCIVSLQTGVESPNEDALFRSRMAERVLDYLEYAVHLVSMAHELVWQRAPEFEPAGDYYVLEAETHLDSVFSLPFGRGIPQRWLVGFLFALDLVVRQLGISLPSHSNGKSEPFLSSSWLDELRRFVNPTYPWPRWPSSEWGLSELSPLSVGSIVSKFEVSVQTVPAKDLLGPGLWSGEGAVGNLWRAI